MLIFEEIVNCTLEYRVKTHTVQLYLLCIEAILHYLSCKHYNSKGILISLNFCSEKCVYICIYIYIFVSNLYHIITIHF